VRILLFGGDGQLGHELRKRAVDLEFDVVSPVITEVDITEREQVARVVRSVQPDVVINCAAYTAVDRAEEESESVFRINRDGPAYVGEACAKADVRCIHISTDYVFDGSLGRPLREDDLKNPLSVYGRSKWEGEELFREALGEKALIVRTQALYGQKGINFVQTMLKLFSEREVVKVVNDQWVSPTWAGWLAEVLLDCARLKATGVVHASSEGAVSWFDFAREIRTMASPYLNTEKVAVVEPCSAADLNRPAKRPTYSAFDTSKLSGLLGRPAIKWRTALELFLEELGVLKK